VNVSFQVHPSSRRDLGDFTTTSHVIFLSAVAIAIGVVSAFVALALLRLIGLFTNLFFYQRWATNLVSPAGNHLGALVILVPVLGALIVGLMARYGSERIRGHGIPEASRPFLFKAAGYNHAWLSSSHFPPLFRSAPAAPLVPKGQSS